MDWNGAIKSIKDMNNKKLEIAPFNEGFGINYEEKIVCYWGSSLDDYTYFICGLIHEMGHVFASLDGPKDSDEYSFFGWEFLLSQEIGLSLEEFIYGNRDYNVETKSGCHKLMYELSTKDAIEAINSCINLSYAKNLIINDKPIAIR